MTSRKLLIKRVTLAVFLVATCNFVCEFYSLYIERLEAVGCYFGPPRDLVARVHIEMFLGLVLIGNRMKRLPRTLLNVTGLTGAVISYILWWQCIFRWARNAETTIAAIPNFGYLVGGNILDLVIAASIGVLVLLNVRDAVLAFVSIAGDDR